MNLLAHSGPTECYREENLFRHPCTISHDISPFERFQYPISVPWNIKAAIISIEEPPFSPVSVLSELFPCRSSLRRNVRTGWKNGSVFSKSFRNLQIFKAFLGCGRDSPESLRGNCPAIRMGWNIFMVLHFKT